MSEIGEKISALYDGELSASEADDLLNIIQKDKKLQKKLSSFSIIQMAMNSDYKKSSLTNFFKNKINSVFKNIWLTNSLTAAASILLTLTFLNNADFSRMDISSDSAEKIASAISSVEAKKIVKNSEEFLADHIMQVINNPKYMQLNNPVDLKNIGYEKNIQNGYNFSKGNEYFQIRIEKRNFGLKKIKYWKYGNKMIYLIPLGDDRVVTIYGILSLSSAINIAESLIN